MAGTTGSDLNVRAVVRAAAILDSFLTAQTQSLAEVTQATKLDKGTTRRLLLTLMTTGLIRFDTSTQRYSLGRQILNLATSVVDTFDVRTVAAPVLKRLSDRLQTTAFLSVYQDGQAFCIDRVHALSGMEVRWWNVGSALPPNCGAAPKVLLAHQSPMEIERILSRPLEAITPKSETDPAKLREHLAVIRKRGWELAVDDVAVGLAALAAPCLSPTGETIASVSIGGLTPQMVNRGKPVHLDCVLDAAAEIARLCARG
jgi:IclR family transcriptional regulator, KDG regulon repressor